MHNQGFIIHSEVSITWDFDPGSALMRFHCSELRSGTTSLLTFFLTIWYSYQPWRYTEIKVGHLGGRGCHKIERKSRQNRAGKPPCSQLNSQMTLARDQRQGKERLERRLQWNDRRVGLDQSISSKQIQIILQQARTQSIISKQNNPSNSIKCYD